MAKRKIAVRINAGNDVNGNGRRGWLVFNSDGTLCAMALAGCEGTIPGCALDAALAPYGPVLRLEGTITVPPKYFRECMKYVGFY